MNRIKNELEALVVQMISALNLIWIIPLCLIVSGVVTAFFISASQSNREWDIYEEGIQEGMKRAGHHNPTLESYINETYNGDDNAFLNTVTGFIYGVDSNGQLEMVFLDVKDILKYKPCEIMSISGEFMGTPRPIIKVK